MGTMKLPSVDNPYGVPIAISQPGGMQSEIITAPESPMSVRHAGEAMNKLSGDLRDAYDKWQLEIDKDSVGRSFDPAGTCPHRPQS